MKCRVVEMVCFDYCSGSKHGRDPVATGLRVMRASVGTGEGQRVLWVRPATDRQVPYAAVRRFRRHLCMWLCLLYLRLLHCRFTASATVKAKH